MNDVKPLALKDLINFLFDNILHPDGRPYYSHEVADHVRISHATINQLRTGRNKNPTLPTVREICRFFDISLNFFSCETYDECYDALVNKEPETVLEGCVAEITYRASRLPLEVQEFLLKLISWAEAAEREKQRERQHNRDDAAVQSLDR